MRSRAPGILKRIGLTLLLVMVVLIVGLAGIYDFPNTFSMSVTATWLLLKIWPATI